GQIGDYLNHPTGFSAYLVRRLGLDMDELRCAVAAAPDEATVQTWIAQRVDATTAPALNAKFETFVAERMSPDDQILVRTRHPVMNERPELSKLLDIIAAEDERLFGASA